MTEDSPNEDTPNKDNPVIVWITVFLVVLVFFYALDHTVMSAQGLPLNLDLTPVQ